MKIIAGIFFAAVNLVYAAVFGGPIDGTVWDVKVRQEGFFHWTSHTETLVFRRGKAAVASELAQGSTPTVYDSKGDDAGTAFTLTFAGAGRDPSEWSGRVEGARINGSVVVRGRDGRTTRYVFHGERKTG